MKFIGVLFMLSGTAGILYSWVQEQKEKQMHLEHFLLFFQKSLYVMQNEKIKVADYFRRYIEQENGQLGDDLLKMVLIETVNRLSTNTYPNGQMVWKEVLQEEMPELKSDHEAFRIVVQAGNGFFGRSREENINFLNRSIKELEKQKEEIKEKDARERKVWIPVGMLGMVMLVILFL